MAPTLSFLISLGSERKEHRRVCLSEAKTSHSHKMWNEVSSSLSHFLQMELLLSPIIYKCILRLLCPVGRPTTTLDCFLLKDNTRALVARLRPEINSRACLCLLQRPQYNPKCCCPSIQRFIYLLMFCLERKRLNRHQLQIVTLSLL